MEAFAAIFKELYTSFLLRDFAGKIVPGTLLILAFGSLFIPIGQVFKAASGRVAVSILVLVAGLAWTIMLGLQSAAEAVKIWRYYPDTDETGSPLPEMKAQLIVEHFLQIACQAERQQYERFVVIKEATGNLFISFVLAVPMVVISYLMFTEDAAIRSEVMGTPIKIVRTVIIVAMGLLIAASLISMNHKHVNKQYLFAAETLKHLDTHSCPADENKVEGDAKEKKMEKKRT